MSPATRLPTYYLSHGGGPWPYLKGDMRLAFSALETSLQAIPRQLGRRPSAVLVVSGHWEGPQFAVTSSARPPMVYDYSGFPAYTYDVQYTAPGSPELAARIRDLLQAGGHPTRLDPERGFDHGTFSMLQPLYPEADIPVLQLGLRADFDPAAHLDAGRLLAPLRDEGVLILGSGSSFHNMRQFGPAGARASELFDKWLNDTLVDGASGDRPLRLLHWDTAPAARQAHPREDHLLPLMVAVGAASGEAGTRVYHQRDFFGSMVMSSFRFGAAADPA